MSKEQFVEMLKDPLQAEAKQLDELVNSLALGNSVETLPGRTLMYITIFMDHCYIGSNEKAELEYQVSCATKHWWLEGITYDDMHSQISMGFRER